MKLTSQFDQFLVNEVNLNRSRIETLENHVGAVERFIKECNWGTAVREFSRQGSWAHGTIIKPLGTRAFDADLLVLVDSVTGWSAADYLEKLYTAFRLSKMYRDMVSRKTRCLVVTYAGDFSLDVVPCVVNRGRLVRKEICNRHEDMFELTDGQGYATWWEKQCALASGRNLKKVTRLLKYLRDIKLTFSAKSILLTTLIGEQVNAIDVPHGNLDDVPATLKIIVNRLDDYLQDCPKMPDVRNPALSSENFTRHWDTQKYENFRDKIHTYRSWIDDAYAEPDRDESIEKWRRIFGEDFAAETLKEEARSIRDRLLIPGMAQPLTDAVAAVRIAGREILHRIPANLPWVQRNRWHMARNVTVSICADVYDKRFDGRHIGPLKSGQLIPKSREILLAAVNTIGSPFQAADYDVWWRVVNTDEEAAHDIRQLRGGFYKSDAGPSRRWETTQYRGPHWVEAFVVRRRDKICIGQSERFFVVVE